MFSLFLRKPNSQITELFETTPAANPSYCVSPFCYCNHTVSEKIKRKGVKKGKKKEIKRKMYG